VSTQRLRTAWDRAALFALPAGSPIRAISSRTPADHRRLDDARARSSITQLNHAVVTGVVSTSEVRID